MLEIRYCFINAVQECREGDQRVHFKTIFVLSLDKLWILYYPVSQLNMYSNRKKIMPSQFSWYLVYFKTALELISFFL